MTATLSRRDLEQATGAEVRAAVRTGTWRRTTHGLARGFVQANLAIVPQGVAEEFRQFCEANPKPCPIIGISAPGDPEMRGVASGSDLRTDLPGYRIYRDGGPAEAVGDLTNHWRADHVAFLLGCSNSMDEALLAAGIPQRHLETEDGRLSVYTSAITCRPAGCFHGPMVVSMRPIPEERVADAAAVSARYPLAHGGPVHTGDPRAIGIADLSAVEWGRYNPPRAGEVPVFWACGVTPQAVAMACRIPEMITHAAGHMFVTDLQLSIIAKSDLPVFAKNDAQTTV